MCVKGGQESTVCVKAGQESTVCVKAGQESTVCVKGGQESTVALQVATAPVVRSWPWLSVLTDHTCLAAP